MQAEFFEGITAEHVFECLGSSERDVCFLKSHSSRGWQTFVAWNPVAKFMYRREQCLAEKILTDFIAEYPNARIVGYFSYDLGYELYKLKQTAQDDLHLPDMQFCAYENHLLFTDNGVEVHYSSDDFLKLFEEILEREVALNSSISVISNFEPEMSKQKYEGTYNKIKHYIVEGDIYQINLTHRLRAEVKTDAKSLFLTLLKNNPVDFMAYIEGDGFEILSASPERFVKITDRVIETCPVKGTRPRGQTPQVDERLKQELLASEKEAAELNMITDLLRNDIGKVSEVGTVEVTDNCIAEAYPSVWHTYSRVIGRLRSDITSARALLSMLPGGSITGCPKKRAMEIIDELEPTTRSVYTGSIGYFDPNGDADFNIAIRTIIKKDNALYLQVGGGIVYDSKEQAEYQETFDKAKSFIRMLNEKEERFSLASQRKYSRSVLRTNRLT